MVETSRAPHSPAGSAAAALTVHGFADGEIIVQLTPEGERAVAPLVGKPPTPLRLGIPSIDRLNVKYRANAIDALPGERATYRLRLSPDANVMRAVEEYGRDPLVVSAEPNYTFRIPRGPERPEAVQTRVK